MNYRRLIFGLSVLCIVVGSLLACFATGGIFWRPSVQEVGFYSVSSNSFKLMPGLEARPDDRLRPDDPGRSGSSSSGR